MSMHKHNTVGDVRSSIEDVIKNLESTLETLSLIDGRVSISDLPSKTSTGISMNPAFCKFYSFTKTSDNSDNGKFYSFTKKSDNLDTPVSNRLSNEGGFRVGDLVEIIKDKYTIYVGLTGVVTKISPCFVWIQSDSIDDGFPKQKHNSLVKNVRRRL